MIEGLIAFKFAHGISRAHWKLQSRKRVIELVDSYRIRGVRPSEGCTVDIVVGQLPFY